MSPPSNLFAKSFRFPRCIFEQRTLTYECFVVHIRCTAQGGDGVCVQHFLYTMSSLGSARAALLSWLVFKLRKAPRESHLTDPDMQLAISDGSGDHWVQEVLAFLSVLRVDHRRRFAPSSGARSLSVVGMPPTRCLQQQLTDISDASTNYR